jgi:4'-phosphopantetheinyl transferase
MSYITQTTPNLNPSIAFNVSHDNALIAMAFGPGDHEPPAFQVGVDVMKVEIPPREPFPQFVRIFSEQVRKWWEYCVFVSHSL